MGERKRGREGERDGGSVMELSLTLALLARRKGGNRAQTGSTLGASRGDTRYLCWCQNYAYKVKIRLLVVLLDGLGEQ